MVLSTKFLMVFCMKVLRVVLAKHEVWHFYVDWRCICLSKSKIWSPKCAVFARPLPMCISVFFCCQLLKNWFKMPCDQVCVSNFSYNEIFYFQNWYQQLSRFLLTVQLTKSKKKNSPKPLVFYFFGVAWDREKGECSWFWSKPQFNSLNTSMFTAFISKWPLLIVKGIKRVMLLM